MNLHRVDDPSALQYVQDNTIPKNVISVDAASVLFVDEKGNRWRLPKGNATFDSYREAQREPRGSRSRD